MTNSANNKNTSKLRFPEFTNDGEWEEKTLGKVATFSKGKGISKEDIIEKGKIKCVRYGELYTTYSETIINVISSTNIDFKDLVIGEKNDILIPSSGETQIDIAKASCLLVSGIALGGDINIIKTTINGIFLSYYLNGAKKREIAKMAQGISVVHLYSSQLQNLNINYPKPQEQQKIADCLLSLDELIAAQTDKVEALKTHKKGLIQQLFPAEGQTLPKLRFKEFENDGEWEENTLGDIAKNLDSLRVPITESNRIKGDIPYYGASGVIDYISDYIFDDDLLCISEDGANLLARTYPIAFSISGKTWVNNHAHVLKFKYKATQFIVETYLNFKNLEDFLTGMAQPKLNRAMLDKIPIRIPRLKDEQQKIADCLSSIDEQIAAESERLSALKVHKSGLMQGLFPMA